MIVTETVTMNGLQVSRQRPANNTELAAHRMIPHLRAAYPEWQSLTRMATALMLPVQDVKAGGEWLKAAGLVQRQEEGGIMCYKIKRTRMAVYSDPLAEG